MTYRLYGRVVQCDRPLEFHSSEHAADLVIRAGDVSSPANLAHDVADPGGSRRLKVWDLLDGPIVDYDNYRFGLGHSQVTYQELAADHESPFDLVVERVVVPLVRLLHEPETCALHGSAVVVDGSALVFIGASGAGKSTTARLLARHGRFACDDLTLVDGRGVVNPSAAGVRAYEAIHQDGRELFPGSAKRWYRLDSPPPEAAPVGAIVHLSRADRWDVSELRGTRAVVTLLENAFDLERPGADWRSARLAAVTELARRAPVIRVVYPSNAGPPSHTDELLERLKPWL